MSSVGNSSPFEESEVNLNYGDFNVGNDSAAFYNDFSGSGVPEQDQYTLPYEVQVGLLFMYGLNIFFSVAGNIVVIYVFSYGRKSRTELAPFLINLAISDLIMALFCMPFTSTQVLLGKWIYPHFLCPAVSFMQHTSVSASIYTQAFISIDRLRSICRPFRQLLRATNTSNQLLATLCLIWLWSLLQASVQLFVSKVQITSDHSEDVNASYIYLCLETWPDDVDRSDSEDRQTSVYSRYYTIWVFSVDYVIPLFCIGCAYSYIGRKLWERTTPGEAAEMRDKHQLQSKRKVIKMLALMVLSFGLLWLPLHIFFLLHDFSAFLKNLPPKYYHMLFVCCHFVSMLTVVINIIIYVVVNKNFKNDFWSLLDRHCLKCLTYSESRREAAALRRSVPNVAHGPFRQSLYHHQLPVDNNGSLRANGRRYTAPRSTRSSGPRPDVPRSSSSLRSTSHTASLPLIDYSRHGQNKAQSLPPRFSRTLSGGIKCHNCGTTHSKERPCGRSYVSYSGHTVLNSMQNTQKTPQSSPSIHSNLLEK